MLWGAAVMQAAYLTPLTQMRWQHAWQYAAAMVLLAVASFSLAGRLQESRTTAPLASAQIQGLAGWVASGLGLLGAGGVLFLLLSGKLAGTRSDWIANRIFLVGAALLLVIAALDTWRRHRGGGRSD
jgi:hypothetical protein